MSQIYYNYIGGYWVESDSGQLYESINPANRDVLGQFQLSDETDVEMAVNAADKSFEDWANTPAPKRGDVIFNLIQILQRNFDDLAQTIAKEVGKSYREAKGEVKKTIEAMKQFSGEATRITGETGPSHLKGVTAYTVRDPLGVVGVIAPYNFPLGIGIWKIAPAIIAGNTVVFKPASNTSLISIKIMEMFEEAGVPSGVINMVTGPGGLIGNAIGNHPRIKAVSFTGSTDVGLKLGRAVSERGAKVQAEMGGKNPAIILEDADIDQAIEDIVVSGFLDNGQRCTGTSRLIVPKSISRTVTDKLVNRAKKLVIGDGFKEGVDNGAIIDENQMNRYLSYVDSAISEGAKLEFGGRRLTENGLDKGYFVEPTVLSQVTNDMKLSCDEIFAPVIGVIEVEDYKEALKIANETEFGLSSTIYTNDLHKAHHFIRNIKSGVTHVNMPSTHFENQFPFGGYKASSIGPREQGSTALEFWTQHKSVYIKP
ncbi:aldehyde dehydrogenase family protein [Aquisalibacillus elongatus]|uniref:Aldehyde dehydrogenase (NAD+) n=1 Tax=Aquisalibacillus elongatus TaxID=485577 RepID=A0A3N5B9R9_9BACI|nr:aldehyde dehydrogenase family protein [Aquisalibacillus elongatus]RPF52220.1 aldehyde dehydrogenase (NAD+) [Aquisalibacillus elongatus]